MRIRQRYLSAVSSLITTFAFGFFIFSLTPLKVQIALPPANTTPRLQLRYEHPSGFSNRSGDASFNVSDSLLVRLGFPIADFRTSSRDRSSRDRVDEIVFVTAADDYYFHTDMDAIARVQMLFPNNRIHFWDLGLNLSSDHHQRLQLLCNVEYRKFNFELYPSFVRELKTYAWKILIIHETLRQHDQVFWFDSSIRFNSTDLASVWNRASSSSRGVLMFTMASHSIFATTHATMYRYLPIDSGMAAEVAMLEANAINFQLSQQTYDAVLRWLFLCALDENCIAPTRDIECRFLRPFYDYAGCHRYDQSAVNILLANYFDNDVLAYRHDDRRFLSVRRYSRDEERLRVCLTGTGSRDDVIEVMSKDYFRTSSTVVDAT